MAATLSAVLTRHGFQSLAGSAAHAWRRGPIWVLAEVGTSPAAQLAHIDLHGWCAGLSAPRQAAAEDQLKALVAKDGFALSDLAPRFCRDFAGEDLEHAPAVASELEASFLAEVQPLLDALHGPDDLALLYMRSPFGPPAASKRRKLPAILASGGAAGNWPSPDAPAPEPLREARTLIDAARWLSLGGGAVVEALSLHGFRSVPKALKDFSYLEGLVLALDRGPYADVLRFDFGSWGRNSTVRCFSWVPEMNGGQGAPLRLLDAGTVAESMAAWWLAGSGPADHEHVFDLTAARGRSELAECLVDRIGSTLSWFESRRSLSDLMELPEGAWAWFRTPAGKAMAATYTRSVEAWKATVKELSGNRYPA